ncbi:MAG: DUF1579 domain-containing protein [Planctomycetota bacterium]
MRTPHRIALSVFGLTSLGLVGFGVAATQEPPPPPEPLEQHQWLQRLAGEWEMTFGEAFDEGQVGGTEVFRPLGGLWVLSEGTAKIGDTTFESRMTLGYDPGEEAFVGTWIDTVQMHLWVYRGQLDAEGKVLTLETEGPSMFDPEATARYRDQIRWLGEHEKQMTSSYLDAQGEWVEMMVSTARRKR